MSKTRGPIRTELCRIGEALADIGSSAKPVSPAAVQRLLIDLVKVIARLGKKEHW